MEKGSEEKCPDHPNALVLQVVGGEKIYCMGCRTVRSLPPSLSSEGKNVNDVAVSKRSFLSKVWNLRSLLR